MNWASRGLGYAVVAGIIGISAFAADGLVPATVRVEVQMVSVSVAEARHLVPALQDRETVEDAVSGLQGMLSRDQAQLIDWPVLWLRSGPHISEVQGQAFPYSKSVAELRYPTEFNPPQQATIFERPLPIHPTWGQQVPTAYETREMGSAVEVQAEVDAAGRITLYVTPHFVRLTAMQEYRAQQSPLGIEGRLAQPNFLVANTSVAVRVGQNQPVLLGSIMMPEPQSGVLLFIARARATLPPPEPATSPAPK